MQIYRNDSIIYPMTIWPNKSGFDHIRTFAVRLHISSMRLTLSLSLSVHANRNLKQIIHQQKSMRVDNRFAALFLLRAISEINRPSVIAKRTECGRD